MILDGHIHMMGATKPIDLSNRMRQAGIDGGVIISRPPKGYEKGADFQESAESALALCQNVKDCFPFFWIDPLEADAVAQVDEAVKLGFAGFKILLTSCFPQDARVMEVCRRIAHHKKPVLFHSGILWQKGPCSDYNRPAHFECLMEVEGLRFSLAHIAWPWCEECIAVYGKAQMTARGIEMFVDITPGTPEIARRDALYHLLFSGYSVDNNVIFGTDCESNDYNSGWAKAWVKKDTAVYEELSVTETVRERIFGKNLLRFIEGK